MKANEIIIEIVKRGAKLQIVDNKLKINAPRGAIDSKLQHLISENKSSIIDIVKESIWNEEINIVPLKKYYSLTSAQKRLFFLSVLDSSSIAYNMPKLIKLEGRVDKEKINKVCNELIKRHESLRTTFTLVDGVPKQSILSIVNLDVELFRSNNEDLHSVIKTFIRPFNLNKPPLLRVGLVQISNDEHILLVDMHHIISDGVSTNILIKDFISIYADLELPPLKIHFKDFAEWNQSDDYKQKVSKNKEFWLSDFSKQATTLELPTDFRKDTNKAKVGKSYKFNINKEITNKLILIAKNEDVTLYMILLSAYNILLSKLCGQKDIVIGTVVSGRENQKLENIIGLFAKTLPIRNFPLDHLSFKEFMHEVKSKALACIDNQSYPFEDLIDELKIDRNVGRNPLFDVTFSFQNIETTEFQIPNLTLKPVTYNDFESKFALTLSATENNGQLVLAFIYTKDLFKTDTVKEISNYFFKIVSIIANNIDIRISEITLASDEEYKFIQHGASENLVNDLNVECIQDKVERYVHEDNAEIAIEYKKQKISYAELACKSNNIAKNLIKNGVSTGSYIGIFCENRYDLICSMLGILKARCIFVPLNISFPDERIITMIKHLGIEYVLSDYNLKDERINADIFQGINWILTELESAGDSDFSGINTKYTLDDPVYVYFTSGTTGDPKGVIGLNKSLSHFIDWEISTFNVTDKHRFSQFISPGFDAILREIFVALSTGATLCIPDNELIFTVDNLKNWITDNNISFMHCVPSVFRKINSSNLHKDDLKNLQYILLSGEEIYPNELEDWVHLFNDRIQLYNLYGSTETTMISSFYKLKPSDVQKRRIPIGKPINNTQLLILNDNLEICSPLVLGQIYVRTPYRTDGYFNKSLNKDKFIQNPYSVDPKDLLYKTGDIGRQLSDGNFEYLGRNDEQIKIRGMRVDLSEVNNFLLEQKNIKESIITSNRDLTGELILCAYFCSDKEINTDKLRKSLALLLPSYMVPSIFCQLKQMPIGNNGKIDKKALPELEFEMNKEEIVPPSNKTEEDLVELWSEVLNIDKAKISIVSNFFSLGGNSFKAIALVNKIFKKQKKEIPLIKLFEYQDIKGLAEYLDASEDSTYLSIEKRDEEEEFYYLSSAQKAMYFLHEFDKTSLVYNNPRVLMFEGGLDKNRLQIAAKKIIQRHEILRTSFHIINDEPVQVISKKLDFEIEVIQSTEEKVRATLESLIAPFDLEVLPLIKIILVETSPLKHYLYIDFHHILLDGSSVTLFIKEFSALYNDEKLPEVKLQYKDYINWNLSEGRQKSIAKQKEFWINEFSDGTPILELPTDFNRPKIKSFEGSYEAIILDSLETEKIKSIVISERSTDFVFFLSVFNVLLYKLTSQKDIVVGTTIAGREHADLENVMGLFAGAIPLRHIVDPSLSFKQFLGDVKTKTLTCFDNQGYQYDDQMNELKIERDASRHPFFDVMYMLHNYDRTSLKLSELNYETYHRQASEAKFDITFAVSDRGTEFSLVFDYCIKLFKKQTIIKYLDYLKQIISAVINNVEAKIADIEIISDEEKKQILYEFNGTSKDICRDKTFSDLFIENVNKTPSNIAVEHNRVKLTYQDLADKALRLSSLLSLKGIQQGDNVVLFMPRGNEMLISILATFHSGAAYIPIDIEFPDKRINEILVDSEAKIIITTKKESQRISGFQDNISSIKEFILIDQLDQHELSGAGVNIEKSIYDPAYIIYTSGSTGKPKGVIIHQLGMMNHLYAMVSILELGEKDVIAQTASPCFDISVWQFLNCLIVGGKTYIVDKETILDPGLLMDVIQKDNITIFQTVPSLLTTILDNIQDGADYALPGLRWMIPTGEASSVAFVNKWYKIFPYIPLLNAYGPAEASDDVTTYVVEQPKNDQTSIPIGKPIQNLQVFILDNDLNLCPIGVKGEICIAGLGVGKGYWKNEDKTKEAFILNPFNQEGNPDYRMLYKTGDLGCYLENGNVNYLGRTDDQIKIRGFRIELGEIENQLLSHELILDLAINIIVRHGEKFIVAYYVSEKELKSSDLEEYISERLPYYMMPSYFIWIDKLPVTINGKLDKTALPLPDLESKEEFLKPSNEIEAKLLEVWASVLKIDTNQISSNSNFFYIGGHSLNAIILVNKIYKEFDLKISLKDLFNKPTIKLLAQHIDARLWLAEGGDGDNGEKISVVL